MSAPGKRPLGIHSDDAIIRSIFEGTAAHTGPEFFESLVRYLALSLDVAGAWVTELDAARRRLRAHAFWFQDRFIPDFEYAIAGTPCEPVIESCSLFHVPSNVVDLYPRDPELAPLGAVSYLGLPLVDRAGVVSGHLAVLDVKPLILTSRIENLFRVFAARAAAEMQRMQAETALHERERELAVILDSAWDAIFVVDARGSIRQSNRSAAHTLNLAPGTLEGREFLSLLSPGSAETWRSNFAGITMRGAPAGRYWIGGLELLRSGGDPVPAEASLSGFERNGERFWTVILRSLDELRDAQRHLAALTDELAERAPTGSMTGQSAGIREVFAQIDRVAATDATVLICGETGTGKELVARAIHEASSRRGKPMIRVNCAAIPATLIESEFFGHERGAFTGATQRREGRFSLADHGTLFLDEVGELPLDLQAKLLRVLQEGEFEPVGSSRTRKVDVRIIAATNRDLRGEAERGRFRLDLFYRLNVFPIHVPPLRERGEDIGLLAQSFLERFGSKSGRRFSPLSPSALALLHAYDWPGNVRELENVLERAAILSRDGEIVLDSRVLPAPAAPVPASPAAPAAEPRRVLTSAELLDFERQNLIHALEACRWRVSGPEGAAKLLGVPPSTVASRIKALGIARPRENS